MSNGGSLELILAALKEWGGYFVWPDSEGEEYVVIARRDFDVRLQVKGEEQLDLLKGAREFSADRGGPWTAGDMLEKINRDLALYQLQREEEKELAAEESGRDEGQFPLLVEEGKPFDLLYGSAELTVEASLRASPS